MYSRLDLGQNSSCIDLAAESSLDETISNFIARTERGSVGIGYSMGARLALACALREPKHFAGLVLISVNTGISDIAERSIRYKSDQDLAAAFEEDPKSGFSILDSSEVFNGNFETQKFLQENRIFDSTTLVQQIKVLGLGEFDSLESDLNTLRIPVLYISGTRDEKYTKLAARYKKQTPFSHHKVLDSDHRVPISAPRTLSLYIDWFSNNVI